MIMTLFIFVMLLIVEEDVVFVETKQHTILMLSVVAQIIRGDILA